MLIKKYLKVWLSKIFSSRKVAKPQRKNHKNKLTGQYRYYQKSNKSPYVLIFDNKWLRVFFKILEYNNRFSLKLGENLCAFASWREIKRMKYNNCSFHSNKKFE